MFSYQRMHLAFKVEKSGSSTLKNTPLIIRYKQCAYGTSMYFMGSRIWVEIYMYVGGVVHLLFTAESQFCRTEYKFIAWRHYTSIPRGNKSNDSNYWIYLSREGWHYCSVRTSNIRDVCDRWRALYGVAYKIYFLQTLWYIGLNYRCGMIEKNAVVYSIGNWGFRWMQR